MLYFKDYTSWAATGVGICGKAKRNYAEATRLSILRSRLLRRTGTLRAKPRSPLAIPPRDSARGILAKASEI